ncbi:hypothetical protein [Flavisphingomonas formosensis]|uniref:hypothetical protein n=1 Tax=Flavisphingomonas formosensis TaxID=861534 RepID=UPI0012FBFBFE|nr:hypothetical protein [Sphingomonas formosensis]
MIEFAGSSGETIRLDPDLIESVRPDHGAVIVRLINGVLKRVSDPYSSVLEKLARC